MSVEKKALFIVVPHQDDEINLSGNCVSTLIDDYQIYVIYSSIAKKPANARIRKKEAVKSCGILGIPKEQIIFLDYPDTPNMEGYHFFGEGDRKIVSDLEQLLEKYKPAVIFGTDFDYHSDHRMLSIALEMAVGNVVSKHNQDYHPIVLKGFCYETAYYGKKDYFESGCGMTEPMQEIMSNPVYQWENRISLANREKVKYYWQRKTYKALLAHRSQFATIQADSVMNRDNVFWLRRTDNLLLSKLSEIKCSSGDGKRLNDFLILNTNDLITVEREKIDFSESVWKPEKNDSNPVIEITLAKKVPISKIVLHGNLQNTQKQRIDGVIIVGNRSYRLPDIEPYGRDTVIRVEHTETAAIRFQMNGYIELSEIEIFSDDQSLEHEVTELAGKACTDEKSNVQENFKLGKKIYSMRVLLEKVKRKIYVWKEFRNTIY